MSAPVRPGDVVAGKYRIDSVLGEGGMGVVVAAHHLHLDEKVAIKLLLPQALESQEVVARFAREARAAAKIKSEHVARVIDVGTLENGAPFMVMEFLNGQDLGQVLRQNGPLPVSVAAHHVIEACEALAEAHALDIVHRDVKPSNLFLARLPGGESIIKVLDFGISKLGEQASDLSLTKTQSMLGTPLYMSVEQMTASKDTDARADIWSLGVVLYELVTGRVPFNGENAHAVLAAMLQTTPAMPSEIRSEIPSSFDAVVRRCLSVDAKKRFANVAELARALAQFSPGEERVERISRVLGVPLGSEESPESLAGPPTPPAIVEAQESQVTAATAAKPPATPVMQTAPPKLLATVVGTAEPRPSSPQQTQGSWSASRPAPRSYVWAPVAVGGALVLGVGGLIAMSTGSKPAPSTGIVQTAQSEPIAPTPSSRLLPLEYPSSAAPVQSDRAVTVDRTPPPSAQATVAPPRSAPAKVSASAAAAPASSVAVVPAAAPPPAPNPPAPASPPAPPPAPHRDNPLDMRPK